MRFIGKFLLWCFSLGLLGLIAAVLFVVGVFIYFSYDLPNYSTLKDYEPSLVTRVHSGDGRLLDEFAQENRIFVPSEEIPDLVKNAFLAAEDKNFYTHKGVDPMAIARAMASNIKNAGSGRRPIGASTITQQVAKNFLLTNEVSYTRKIREAIVAYRMDKAMSKDRILELYLNEIFLGQRSYGVASAALNYFNKSLDELAIEEAAYLAALPKAPNNYHPVRNKEDAVERRNWVIDEMADNDFITESQAEMAKLKPLEMVKREADRVVNAPYFAEEVRREMVERYGEDSILKSGLSIRTSVDPTYQRIAEEALRDGLLAFDRRHGWRGPLERGQTTGSLSATIENLDKPEGMLDSWQFAVVLDGSGRVALREGAQVNIRSEDVKWAGGGSNALKTGDIVMVEKVGEESAEYYLRQVPKIQGGIVVIDPNTGRVLAMQGGWAFDGSQYNRATQARRQPGSAFKPYVYLTALDQGYTPSTLVMDAPFEYTDTAGNVWRPKNYSNKFYGATPLRVGIEKSRNLMTVRLANHIGIEKVVDTAKEFGIDENMKPHLANALGAGETTLLKLTNAYAMLVNGGNKITPSFIDRIQDRYGNTVFKTDEHQCRNCGPKIRWENQDVPNIPDIRPQIGNPQTIYQIVSILEGVVERGTGQRLKSLGRPLAGKTGTTNESKDTWFVGFTPDLAIGVYVGMDNPKPLGSGETGSSTAAPVFKDFVEDALDGVPATPFRVPEGIKMVRVNPQTGKRVSPLDDSGIWEAFVPGTEPDDRVTIIDDGIVEGYGQNSPYSTQGNTDLYGPSPYSQGNQTDPYSPYQPRGGTTYSTGAQPNVPMQPQQPERQPNTGGTSAGTGTGGLY